MNVAAESAALPVQDCYGGVFLFIEGIFGMEEETIFCEYRYICMS